MMTVLLLPLTDVVLGKWQGFFMIIFLLTHNQTSQVRD